MKRAGRQLGAIALLAMFVRAIVPAGYMLAEADTPDGRYLVVQMCDGHTAAKVVDLDTGELLDASKLPGKSDGKTSSTPCVFSIATPVGAPPVAIEPVVFQRAFAADFVVALAVAPGRGIAAPPPPSTGPPILI